MVILSLKRKVKYESRLRVILKILNRGCFLSCDIFILLFEKSNAGRPVHIKINLVSPYFLLIYGNSFSYSQGKLAFF